MTKTAVRLSIIRDRTDDMSTTTARENIGFIGLGLMGHGIARNIVDKGYSLTFLGRKNRKPAEDMQIGRAHV